MALISEAIEGGLFTVSEATRKFFADYSAALFAKDYTPMEDRPGADEAIDEFKKLFADGFSCQEFKDRLYEFGMFGCGRSRRLKAMAALLGLTDDEVKDCLEEKPQGPGPQVYYLPPEDSLIAKIGLRDLPEPDDEDDACKAPTNITTAEDALCPTDTHRGCTEPDGEDTDDLEDPSDCDTATRLLNDIAQFFPEPALLPVEEQFTPPGTTEIGIPLPNIPDAFPSEEEETSAQREFEPLSGERPIYTARTYLDALYGAINLHEHPKLAKCTETQDLAETLIERINNEIMLLPPGYINQDLLPKGFTTPGIPDVPTPPYRFAGLSDAAATKARRTAASARRYAANRMGA